MAVVDSPAVGMYNAELILVRSACVVRVQARGSPKLDDGGIYQVKRMALFVLVLLQHPRLGLRAAIGEYDAIEVVLDHGLGFGTCGLRRYRAARCG